VFRKSEQKKTTDYEVVTKLICGSSPFNYTKMTVINCTARSCWNRKFGEISFFFVDRFPFWDIGYIHCSASILQLFHAVTHVWLSFNGLLLASWFVAGFIFRYKVADNYHIAGFTL
jgi:hypothetical protein